MRRFVRVAFAVWIVTVSSAGCHRRPPPELEANPVGSEVAIRVVNRNWSDMVIYLDQDGQRTRIGEASGKTTSVLFIPWPRLGANPVIRLLADPIGARGAYVSGRLNLRPGAMVVLTLENDLRQSSSEIY